MKVQIKHVGQAIVAELSGEIDTVDSEGLADALDEIVSQHPTRLVLDFSQVSYIASMGLSLLLKVAQEMRKTQGQLALVRVKPVVKLVLDTVCMGAVIPIEATLEKALEKMDAKAPATV